jgi:Flp pilus assembly pilin Flp
MLVTTDANVLDNQPVANARRRPGATLMEYLMMLSLIIVVCLVAIGYLGTSNKTNMGSSATAINNSLKKGG